jgi:hypothetical protein
LPQATKWPEARTAGKKVLSPYIEVPKADNTLAIHLSLLLIRNCTDILHELSFDISQQRDSFTSTVPLQPGCGTILREVSNPTSLYLIHYGL